ncbi:inositol monophosphatase family protein [Actinokineospora inagensis]|uniref:inositol monophosphatase family protein n=1 Tax=Actinokineospora inagensis TaxID=103730 RepID=UPI00047D8542|nr:inositol monophosphatase family protein [Actinokineospora inagensis]
MTFIPWPVPEPVLPAGVNPVLHDAATSAVAAYRSARKMHTRQALSEEVAMGADGTPSMQVDLLVEDAIAESAQANRVNLLSEEAGFVDNGSATTLVVDPLDGSANAAAGIPLSCFSAVLTRDSIAVEALTVWLDTGRSWWARVGQSTPYRTTGRKSLDGASVSLLRPKRTSAAAWQRVSGRAGRVRVLGTTCLETALVAEGTVDAFVDPGSDTLRIVDLAAALVLVPAAGGAVVDAHGRPLDFDPDLTRRWSGIAAASGELADQIAETVLG